MSNDDDDWVAPWRCPWTKKQHFSFAPDFSGFNPDTGELWSPKDVVKALGMTRANVEETEAVCQQVITDNADKVKMYQAGKKGVFGFFMGQVMDLTHKRADPKAVQEILKRLLENNV